MTLKTGRGSTWRRRSGRGALPTLAVLVTCLVAVPAAAMEKVVLQLRWDHQFQFAGYYAALWNGYYANAGFDVEIRSGVAADGRKLSATREVEKGNADFGVGGADVLVAYDRGVPLVVLASFFQESPVAFYARRETGLAAPADLRQLRVGRRPGDLVDVEFQAMLRADGIDPGLIEPLEPGMGLRELGAGTLDVVPDYTISAGWTSRALGLDLVMLRPVTYGVDFYGDSLFTHRSRIERDPDAVRRFTEATRRGWAHALDNWVQVADRIAKDLPRRHPVGDPVGFNRFQARAVRKAMHYPVTEPGHVNPARWRRMHVFLENAGLVAGSLDLDEFVHDTARLEHDSHRHWLEGMLAASALLFLAAVGFGAWAWTLKRKLSAQAAVLAESEARFRLITDSLPALIGFIDRNMVYRFVNKAYEDWFGVTREQVIGRSVPDLLDPDAMDLARPYLEMALGGEPVTFDSELKHADGTMRTVQRQYIPHRDESGAVDGMFGLVQDITERKRAEEALRVREAQFRLVIDSLPVLIAFVGPDRRYRLVNRTYRDWFGLGEDDVAGCHVREVLGAEVYTGLKPTIDDALAGESSEFTRAIPGPDGKERIVQGFYIPNRTEDGARDGFFVLAQDVTERRRAERQLEKLSRAIEFSPAMVLVTDTRGVIEYANPRVADMTGYIPEDVIGRTPAIFKSGQESEEKYSGMWQALAAGETWKGSFLNRRKDGTDYWVSASISPIFGPEGEITHYVAVEEDVTDIRDATEALRVSEERFDRAQTFANIGTWDWEIATGALHWSERIAPLFGYPAGDLDTTYDNFLAAVHPDDRQAVIDAVNACVEDGAEYDIEHRVVWPDGTVRWLHESGDTVRDADGTALRMLGVVRDVTGRKEAEEGMRRAMEEAAAANRAKSEFLSSMSHELRTPMNAILGFAQLLEAGRKEPLSEKQASHVSHIIKGGQHLLELINEVLDLAKIEAGRVKLSIQDVETRLLVDEVLALARTLSERRAIKVDDRTRGGDLPALRVDYTRAKQVLLNLLSNAVKYNRHGGSVVLEAADRNGALRISVTDTGPGIPADRQAALFKPFERLGAEATEVEGTGIGLTITRELVEMMGGRIGFESTEGEGSTFWVELPVAVAAAVPDQSDQRSGGVEWGGGKRRLLYVEDNPANLRLMEGLVAEIPDLSMDSAHTAEIGFDIATAPGRRPDLIVMDVNLPGMDGIEAVRRLKADPETRYVPVIALSADAMPATVERGLEAGFASYLTKPVDLPRLVAAIEEALGDA